MAKWAVRIGPDDEFSKAAQGRVTHGRTYQVFEDENRVPYVISDTNERWYLALWVKNLWVVFDFDVELAEYKLTGEKP